MPSIIGTRITNNPYRPGYFLLENSSNMTRFHRITPLAKEDAKGIISFCTNFRQTQAGRTITSSDWDKLFEMYARVYQLFNQSTAYLATVKSVAEIMSPSLPEKARILDLGSGTGGVGIGLLSEIPIEQFGTIWMVDKTAQMIQKAQTVFSDVFGDRDIFRYSNCSITDLQSDDANSPAYIKSGFDAVTSCLVLPFLKLNELNPALTACHAMANQGAAIVHVIHKETCNPLFITFKYMYDIIFGNARGSLIKGLREIESLLPAAKSIQAINRIILANKKSLCLLPPEQWLSILEASGMEITDAPRSVYANQAFLYYGRKK